MPFGYNDKILRVNLSQGNFSVEEPGEDFYRRYLGGRGFISYYLLQELNAKVDPLSPENKLIFAPGVLTGAPIGGSGRNSVGAKSPLTHAYGDAEGGGYWAAGLKRAGYDTIIIEGKAETPVYLWVEDGRVELRDARHLWGKSTGDVLKIMLHELGGRGIYTTMIGPAGEKMVRYACIINDLAHAAGRTGTGAVMGAKNLKAIAVRGSNALEMADPEGVEALAQWLRDNAVAKMGRFHDLGTAGGVTGLDRAGGLPTRNFQQNTFEGAAKISGRAMKETILFGCGHCYDACPMRCKRIIALEEPYEINPIYGGPEYETVASLGSNCGIDDLRAIAKGHELCNAYGLDTISTGMSIAFAMECFERGILSERDTDGLELRFGTAEAMLKMVELIAYREGIGDLLAEGTAKAAQVIGKGAEKYALHVKGQPIPMHEPRYKQGMGLGYAMSPTGADHRHNMHDSMFTAPGSSLEEVKALGILEPLPLTDLSPAKVRMLTYYLYWQHLVDCLGFCYFIPFDHNQVVDLVRAVTGWNTSLWELMKVGERCVAMTRAFNIRHGFGPEDDTLPKRFFTPFSSGPLQGVGIDEQKFCQAKETFYSMVGWDNVRGAPTKGKLQELGIDWVADLLAL